MFSVAYVLERYVFTRNGLLAIIAAILAIWALNSLGSGNSGNRVVRSEDDVHAILWVIWAFIYLSVAILVGAIIDGKRGALWGVLGPIGWIIAAIRRLEHRDRSKVSKYVKRDDQVSTDESAVRGAKGYDEKKWELLKEVDPDIKAASDVVVAFDPTLDAVLAEKYLRLSQKEYLQPLVDNLLAQDIERKKEV